METLWNLEGETTVCWMRLTTDPNDEQKNTKLPTAPIAQLHPTLGLRLRKDTLHVSLWADEYYYEELETYRD